MEQTTHTFVQLRRRCSRFILCWIAVLCVAFASSSAIAARSFPRIEFLNLRGADIKDAARLLASLSDAKIIATRKTEGSTVDLFVRDATVTDCLKLICRSTGLVYRYDEESDIFTIMTLEEYRQNVQVDTEGLYQIKVFDVEPANVTLIARAIENLYPDQVIFTEGEQIENFSGAPGTRGGGSLGGSTGDFGDASSSTSSNNRTLNGNFDRSDRFSRSSGFGGGFGSGIGTGTRRQLASEVTAEAALAAEAPITNGAATSTTTTTTTTRARPVPAEPTIFVTTSLEHNQILVRTANDIAMRQIERLVVQLNHPVPQVILEMKILELNVGNGRRIGVEFGAQKGSDQFEVAERDPATGVPTAFNFIGRAQQFAVTGLATEAAAGFVYSYLSRDIQARVQLLANNNNVEVVATPVLIAANNRPAKIEVGEQRVITVGASSDTNIAGETGTRNELVTLETEKRTIGVTLQIIPRINENGTVTLYVQQESTTLKPRNNRLLVGNREVPIDSIDTANIAATVVARNANTVAIGGLIRNENANERQKVPILGDIPLVGRLFGSENISRNKSELILLITPTIVDGGRRANKATAELTSRLSDHSYHVGGEAIIDEKNAELQLYRGERDQWVEDQERILIEEQRAAKQQQAVKAQQQVTIQQQRTTTVETRGKNPVPPAQRSPASSRKR